MRTVNKVILLGNVTWEPELKHSAGKTAVASFGLATNHNAKSEDGTKHEEVDYHRLVSFGRLAEVCAEYLKKGRKVYVEGRLRYRSFTDNDGVQRAVAEIVLLDMVILDSKVKQTEMPKEDQLATPAS